MKWKIRLLDRRVGGYECPLPVVTLWVRTRYLDFVALSFRIDTGADLTGIPVGIAQREGIAFPQTEASRGRASGLVGATERYRGLIHVRIGDEEFDWPCDFLQEPPAGLVLPGAPSAVSTLPVLGRAKVLAAFKVCVDEPWLTIEHRRVGRPWWYRLGRTLLPRRAVEHPADVPL
jgi:hypothetical protein